jgi:hypothetical protein
MRGAAAARYTWIVVASGEDAEIKSRCQKSFVFCRYQPREQYTVESRHGSCAIEVVGNPGTKFELIQS